MKTGIRLAICCIVLSSISPAKSQIVYHFATVHSPASCANTYDTDITLTLDSVQVTNIYFDDGTNGSLGFKAFVSYQNIFSNSTLPAGTFFTYQFSLFTDNPNINPQELTNDAGSVPLQTATAGGFSFQNNPTFNQSASALGLTLNGVYSAPNILTQLGYDSATLHINLPCLDTLIETNESGTLPVLWSPIAATINGNEVALKWETFMEQNNLGFNIERSIDARSWQVVGFINSKAAGGNSSGQLSYQYTQTEPIAGRYFYRIIQRDIDGNWVVSNVVDVLIDNQSNSNHLIVYPNPAIDVIYLRQTSGNTAFSIIDNYGRIVMQGNYLNRIDISKLSRGIYWIRAGAAVSRFVVTGTP